MTDPNVIEALNALGDAVAHLVTHERGEARRSLAGAVAAIDLLAAERPAGLCDRCRADGCPHHTTAAEKPAAPAIVPVKFDADGLDGDYAEGLEWEATHLNDRVHLTIDLRPGEDAGVTTAKILAACGRGP